MAVRVEEPGASGSLPELQLSSSGAPGDVGMSGAERPPVAERGAARAGRRHRAARPAEPPACLLPALLPGTSRAAVECRGGVRQHFLLGQQVPRPFIRLRMRLAISLVPNLGRA